MFKEVKKSVEWGEETLTLETGKVARQADGSVIATTGRDRPSWPTSHLRKSKSPVRISSP